VISHFCEHPTDIMSKGVYHTKNVNIVFKLYESIYLLTNHVKSNVIILMLIKASALLGIKMYCDHNVTFCCLSLSCRKEQYLLWRFHASPLLILLTMDVREAYAYTHIRRLFISSFFSVVLSFWSFDLFIIIYSFIHSFG
jgi:hypothetical protein